MLLLSFYLIFLSLNEVLKWKKRKIGSKSFDMATGDKQVIKMFSATLKGINRHFHLGKENNKFRASYKIVITIE
jgi:hypothetical protein